MLSLDSALVQTYIVHSAILAIKLLLLAPLTGLARVTKGAFANPEDAKLLGGKVKHDDKTVERIRRAHLNDLENIPAFWILGGLYLTTDPVAAWATLLFRSYTVCRFLHTFVYAILPLPQPSRILAFVVPFLINLYMGFQIVLHYIT
ncbi:hypothetical protein O3G_MSEX010987, partial [Manduca sexta]